LKNVGLGIDYADYRAVGWGLVTFERERGLFASAPEDKFTNTGSDRIESDLRLAFVFQIGVERLNEQKLSPFEGFVLYG
jgi:hypothetical protein